jgi:hypothetical protein
VLKIPGELVVPGRPPLPVQAVASTEDIRVSAPNVDFKTLQSLPEHLRKDCLLFYYPDTEPLARRIAAISDKVELGEIRWK